MINTPIQLIFYNKAWCTKQPSLNGFIGNKFKLTLYFFIIEP